jgi:tetratricopeptide (TPR) repeat protein
MMNKENILFGIVGLLAGLIIGFLATNSYNRSVLSSQNAPALPNSQMTGQQNPASQNQSGMMPGVAEAIDKADKNPEDFDSQIKAGEMFRRIKNFEKSLFYYERANKAKPDDFQILVILGGVNFDLDRLNEAQKWFEKALAKNPNDVSVRTDYGLSFFLNQPKDIDRAIKEYKTSLSINPTYEPALQNLAVAYSEKKDAEGVKETIATLEKVNPNNQIIQRLKEAN